MRRCGLVNKAGSTPLDLAVKAGNVVLARLLVDHAADVTARDNHGSTALDIEHGAQYPIQARSTSSHKASHSESVPVARFIVRHDANMTALSYGTDLVGHDVILLYGYSQTILVVMRTACSLFWT